MLKKTKNRAAFANHKLKPVFRDHRGEIFDIVEDVVGHVGMVTFNKGVTRGNHYHKRSTQYSYVLDGKIKLTVSDPDGKRPREFILSPGAFTQIPPRTVHTYTALTPARMLDVTTVTRIKDGYEKDTYKIS